MGAPPPPEPSVKISSREKQKEMRVEVPVETRHNIYFININFIADLLRNLLVYSPKLFYIVPQSPTLFHIGPQSPKLFVRHLLQKHLGRAPKVPPNVPTVAFASAISLISLVF
ncbi:hypothetical protein M8J75_005987 [Diaphorina citri]|nr:hypothetical protein M8J75_005987 [Diaphorina citri]KAI5727353.1 hypothetical protein M8J77_001246 [Diaphorina citri]